MIAQSPLAEQGCSFFSRTPDRVFSVEDFGSDETLMIKTAEDFSRKEILPNVERLEKLDDEFTPNLIRKAGELGFCGVDAPEEYGGLGLGKSLSARILELLSLNGSFSVTVGVTTGISQFGLSAFGNHEQKEKYLPRLTSGEWIGAYALSEPNSGSDALSASTRADFKDGKWILNGTKMWISNAKWAEYFIVFAKVDGDKFTAFLVERSFPGVSIAREEHKMGLKGSSTARLVLENAEVPAENLLYEVGKGHHVAFNSLNMGRYKLAAMSIGPARNAIELATAYSKDRKQFGRSISEFGLIRKKFAEMAARYFAAETMIYRTGSHIDESFHAQEDSIDGKRKAAEEFSVECSACKVFATEAQSFIIDEALQCYGGYGYTEEFPIARHYRDARVSRIYEGTNEINRVFLGERLVRRAKEGRASTAAVGDSFISELAGRAIKTETADQIRLGALSDLVMLTYAEQSTRLRAKQTGGHNEALYRVFLRWANVQAAQAYQTITDESVTIPAPQILGVVDVAAAVLEKGGPLS